MSGQDFIYPRRKRAFPDGCTLGALEVGRCLAGSRILACAVCRGILMAEEWEEPGREF